MEMSEIYRYSLGTNIEGVGRFIYDNWNDLYPRKKRNQNILMELKFSQGTEYDCYAGT